MELLVREKMLFVYSDQNITRLDSGGETCPKHLSHKHPGVGTGFSFGGQNEKRTF